MKLKKQIKDFKQMAISWYLQKQVEVIACLIQGDSAKCANTFLSFMYMYFIHY